MALITVNMSMVKSHGDADVPFADDGLIILTPVSHGVYSGSMRAPEPVERLITRGVMPELELAPGFWRVKIEPYEARSWPTFIVEIKEGMAEPVNLATLAPATVIDGKSYAKGDDGASAYEIAKINGFTGTAQEWLDSLKGNAYELAVSNGFTGSLEEWLRESAGYSAYELAVKYDGYSGTLEEWLYDTKGRNIGVSIEKQADGSLILSGSGITKLEDGSVLIASTSEPSDSTWAVNPLAMRMNRPLSSIWHEPDSDWLYTGYGDWNSNRDEIGVVRTNVLSGESEVVYFPAIGENSFAPTLGRAGAYTEAIQSFFKDSTGAIYIPHTDGAGYYDGCGYISNESGTWSEYRLPSQAIHVFGVAENSQGLWMSGSSFYDDQYTAGPTLWFRPTGDPMWHVIYEESVKGNQVGSERYYGIKVVNDRVEVVPSNGLRNSAYSDPKRRSFKYVPKASGGFYQEELLPVESIDQITYELTQQTLDNWPSYYDTRVSVNSWTFRVGPNGTIIREPRV